MKVYLITQASKPEKLLKLLSLNQNRTGYFELAMAYVGSKNNTSKEFVYQVPHPF